MYLSICLADGNSNTVCFPCAQAPERVPTSRLVVAEEVDRDDEDEFEWVTDSDEEEPEFECDSCGRVIEDTADRFHCESCGDYDLVRPLNRAKNIVWGFELQT